MRGLLTFLSVVGLLVVALALPGCPSAHMTASDFGRELGQGVAFVAAECGPTALADYSQARAALHSGGVDWLSIVLGAGPCIGRVVADERAAHAKGQPCASSTPEGCAESIAAPEAPGEELRMRQVLAVQQLAAHIELPPLELAPKAAR